MTKLLTIAIPTYNRSKQLETQLSWLANAVKGYESDIEIFISDNCSTDNTPDVIEKWRARLTNVTFNTARNKENLGVMRNIMNCLNSARTKYVWAIGDDDLIEDRAVPYVLNKFKQHDDLSLVLLNYSGLNPITGEPEHPDTIVGNRWFDIDGEDGSTDGKVLFEHCLTQSVGAVIFLTALVYRTDVVVRAVKSWPEGVDNWMYLAYLVGYCAANGRTIVTKENYMVCIVAVSYWYKDPKAALLMQYKHQPETVQKLMEVGYSKQFYRSMMVRTLKDANVRVFLGALRRWPALATRSLVSFLGSMGRALVGANLLLNTEEIFLFLNIEGAFTQFEIFETILPMTGILSTMCLAFCLAI